MVNRKETNLDGVKAMARTLLYTDINKTAYSPIVVQHPFTNTGFTMVMRNGEPQCIDITADSNALHEWRKMVCQQIDSSKSAFEIYMMTNKPYGMTFLKYAAHHLSKKDFSQILADAWTRSENPNDDPNLPQAKLLSEFCKPEERHIVSVFKIIQELLAPSNNKQQKNQFNSLMALLPDDHKAKWFAGAALNTSEQSMASVMSTALSRLNAFLDSELETILCNDTEIDAEKFCSEKSAIFIIMPEEDSSKYFMVSLIIQQLYREILAVADEKGGKLKNRVVFYCDEFGTLPKIESAEMMFSASRSRRVSIVPIIQSLAQLEKNYGKEGAEIIVDNTQLTVFGGFAPNSETAQVLSKSLGTRTVMSGSVSLSKNDPSRSLQMIERPLMTADELKSLPKGTFVVTKTGFNPIKIKLKLFFKWGIQFEDKPYVVPLRDNKDICYASKDALMRAVYDKYTTDKKNPDDEIPKGSYSVEEVLGEKNYPESARSARAANRPPIHTAVQTTPEETT